MTPIENPPATMLLSEVVALLADKCSFKAKTLHTVATEFHVLEAEYLHRSLITYFDIYRAEMKYLNSINKCINISYTDFYSYYFHHFIRKYFGLSRAAAFRIMVKSKLDVHFGILAIATQDFIEKEPLILYNTNSWCPLEKGLEAEVLTDY